MKEKCETILTIASIPYTCIILILSKKINSRIISQFQIKKNTLLTQSTVEKLLKNLTFVFFLKKFFKNFYLSLFVKILKILLIILVVITFKKRECSSFISKF
ncbi:hypothetical protein HMPREF3100_01670 [Enterococcus sp. HMSC29A04]|nr:hypothetical protein HMPREF3001_11805 [Enterococcus sp. HMSC066C04]OFT90052.1 hypothetical protein HMPREF3100_01670 [Enterococcus sp. HMSC29A04]OFU65406.1 hypothetical protein HMPREF3128_07310 [Enterococcus sp. HMSC14A10]